MQRNLIYRCGSIHPAKWAAPVLIWGACDAVGLRVDPADHLDHHHDCDDHYDVDDHHHDCDDHYDGDDDDHYHD